MRVISPASRQPQLPKDVNRLVSSIIPSGKVLFQDDMDNLDAAATNHYLEVQGTMARDATLAYGSGLYSLKLTTGAVAGNTAEMNKYVGVPLPKLINLELRWLTTAQEANLRSIYFDLYRYDGAIETHMGVNYIGAWGADSETWRVIPAGTGGNWVNVATQSFILDTNHCWNWIKFVADFENNRYVRLYSNEEIFDLSAYPAITQASAVNPMLDLEIVLVTNTGTAISCYIDDIIISEDKSSHP